MIGRYPVLQYLAALLPKLPEVLATEISTVAVLGVRAYAL